MWTRAPQGLDAHEPLPPGGGPAEPLSSTQSAPLGSEP